MGGSFKREGMCVYPWLIHVDVWQKPTQHCKAIILQVKVNTLKKKTETFMLKNLNACIRKYGFLGGYAVKNPPADVREIQEMRVPSLGQEDPLE